MKPQGVLFLLLGLSMMMVLIARESQQQSCYETNTCVSHHDSCTASWQTNETICARSGGSGCCAFGLVCWNGECVPNNYNAPCNADSQCFTGVPGQSLVCTGRCLYRARVGDQCGSGQVCDPGYSCTNGVCTGASAYSYCDSTHPCDTGLYCNTNINQCFYLWSQGGPCTATQLCMTGLFCYNGYCRAPYSLGYGQSCTISEQCIPGYYCQNGQCVYSYSYNEYLTCYSNGGCSSGSECVCSKFTGESYCIPLTNQNNVCAYEKEQVNNCLVYSGASSISTNPGSRFIENCSDDWETQQRCECESSGAFAGSCMYNDYCGFEMPVWGTVLIVIGVCNCCLVCCGGLFVAIYLIKKMRDTSTQQQQEEYRSI